MLKTKTKYIHLLAIDILTFSFFKKVSFMSSTSEGFINLVFKQLFQGNYEKNPSKQGKKSQYSYSKINDILNVESDDPLQVEANLFLTVFGGARYYALDNHTIEQLPQCKYFFE